jgi:hypothetical protein
MIGPEARLSGMKTRSLKVAFVVCGFFTLYQTTAQSAALKGAIMACKDQADIKKALQHSSDKDGKATAAYFKTRAESGDCLQLTRGQLVDVDERDGPLWCVRPSGGLDCFWTLEKAVDLYPSKASVPGEQQQQSGGRGRH